MALTQDNVQCRLLELAMLSLKGSDIRVLLLTVVNLTKSAVDFYFYNDSYIFRTFISVRNLARTSQTLTRIETLLMAS